MATNFKATIIYKEKPICDIENDNPDLSPLVDFIAKEKEFDENSLLVKSECETFDADDLKKAIVESIIDFKESIEIDETSYQAAMERINNKKDKEAVLDGQAAQE